LGGAGIIIAAFFGSAASVSFTIRQAREGPIIDGRPDDGNFLLADPFQHEVGERGVGIQSAVGDDHRLVIDVDSRKPQLFRELRRRGEIAPELFGGAR